jgi:DTW domain-containing protein YfiP
MPLITLKENIINFNYKELCYNCGLPNIICICDKIEQISLKNKVSVIIPYIERHKSSNTGGLVKAVLSNSEVFIRGEKNKLFNPDKVIKEEYQNLILYTGGRELTHEYVKSFDKPINLIVPDGTWTTAPRIVVREPKFHKIPKVSLINPPKSQYKLRKHPNPYYISTFEAILYSLEIIEDNHKLKDKLLYYFLMKIDNLLWLAGKLSSDKVRGGISDKAILWKTGKFI